MRIMALHESNGEQLPPRRKDKKSKLNSRESVCAK
jgi:hypothetical protein